MENELETLEILVLETLVIWLEMVGNFTRALRECEKEEDFKNYINNKLVPLSFLKGEMEKCRHLLPEWDEVSLSLKTIEKKMEWLLGIGFKACRDNGQWELIEPYIFRLQQSLIRMLLRRVAK
jgi:hypothetical protein